LDFALLIFACARIGAILVPLNTRLQAEELTFMLRHSGSVMLIVDDEFLPQADRAARQVETLRCRFSTGGPAEGLLAFEQFTEPADSAPVVEMHDDDPLFLAYTSGTTGLPKAAIGTHLGVIHSVINYQRIMATNEQDRTLIAVPLFHVTGLIGQYLHMVYTGGTSVLMRRFKAEPFIAIAAEERISFLFNVPTIYVMMTSHPDFRRYTYDNLRLIAYGGAPMPPQTIEVLRSVLPGVRLHNAYGATETSSPTTVMPPHWPAEKAESVGWPVPVAEVKVVDDQGNDCPVNQPGELLIKGPMVIPGYWDNDEANKQSFIDGFWRSGDIARIDEEGYVYIMDRKKEMINRGGEKIFSVEVEHVLYTHPKILEAAVVGVPDPVFGERVKAAVVLKAGETMTSEEVKTFLSGRLANYKVPEIVDFIDTLPRNPGGKVIKKLLR
jgi:acyl-CoA synthetase (AMP-forming)/AMP-acid ligase II